MVLHKGIYLLLGLHCVIFNTAKTRCFAYCSTHTAILLSNFYDFRVLLLTTKYHPLQYHFPIFGFSPLIEFYRSKQHGKVKRLQKYSDKVYINSRKAAEILQNSSVLRTKSTSPAGSSEDPIPNLSIPLSYILSLCISTMHIFLFSPLSLFEAFFC